MSSELNMNRETAAPSWFGGQAFTEHPSCDLYTKESKIFRGENKEKVFSRFPHNPCCSVRRQLTRNCSAKGHGDTSLHLRKHTPRKTPRIA